MSSRRSALRETTNIPRSRLPDDSQCGETLYAMGNAYSGNHVRRLDDGQFQRDDGISLVNLTQIIENGIMALGLTNSVNSFIENNTENRVKPKTNTSANCGKRSEEDSRCSQSGYVSCDDIIEAPSVAQLASMTAKEAYDLGVKHAASAVLQETIRASSTSSFSDSESRHQSTVIDDENRTHTKQSEKTFSSHTETMKSEGMTTASEIINDISVIQPLAAPSNTSILESTMKAEALQPKDIRCLIEKLDLDEVEQFLLAKSDNLEMKREVLQNELESIDDSYEVVRRLLNKVERLNQKLCNGDTLGKLLKSRASPDTVACMELLKFLDENGQIGPVLEPQSNLSELWYIGVAFFDKKMFKYRAECLDVQIHIENRNIKPMDQFCIVISDKVKFIVTVKIQGVNILVFLSLFNPQTRASITKSKYKQDYPVHGEVSLCNIKAPSREKTNSFCFEKSEANNEHLILDLNAPLTSFTKSSWSLGCQILVEDV